VRFSIEPRGPFSLEEADRFGFGQREAASHDGVMRLAFCVDGYRLQAAAAIRQDDLGVHVELQGEVDPDVARAQVARVLSLDHDGNQFTGVGRRDPVIGRLQAVAPGLRPPLFYSPYEAAAWCILSARRPATQSAALRHRLSEAHGATFEVGGRRLPAFPTPEQMLGIDAFAGLDDTKLRRLHGVAEAALEGRLDAGRLRSMGPDEAMADVRRLEGIGPFYSALVVIRATGLADVLPVDEPRLSALVGGLYDLAGPSTSEELAAIAERWRPLRTWAAVLIRAAAHRVPEPIGGRPG